MDNSEKQAGAIRNGQFIETDRSYQEWTIQRNWQELSGMDNSEKQATLGTRHSMKTNKRKTQQRKVNR